MSKPENNPQQTDADHGLPSTPSSDIASPNDELLSEAAGGSFGSFFSDVTDLAIHANPFTGPVSDVTELAISGKTHEQNRAETYARQEEIAEAAGDTGVGSEIARVFLPNTYDEVQKKYVNKEYNDALKDDHTS